MLSRRDELLPCELLTLKEIFLTGHAKDWTLARSLANDELITETSEGFFLLTTVGHKMLVRGSPKLWSVE
jgi:hypothetical protein